MDAKDVLGDSCEQMLAAANSSSGARLRLAPPGGGPCVGEAAEKVVVAATEAGTEEGIPA